MEYTIGQVAKLTGLSISTIRYYDKEGLLNGINRKYGIRSFNDKDLNTIRVIECLKNSGMLIKEIAVILGGSGGGKPDMAFGGTTSLEKLPQAIERIKELAK